MLVNFHMCGIVVVLRADFNMLVRNASPRGHMCLVCQGLCELLFSLCFIASWTRVVVSEMLYPCILCVAMSMDLFVLCVACLCIVW